MCPAYKGTTFSRRKVDEVKEDIDRMAEDHGRCLERVSSAFLQDADTLIIPTAEMLEIIEYLKIKFPNITRITTYARAKSMKKKSVESYKALKRAGLTRIHTGMESGSAKVLKMIRKGSTPEDILTGGIRVMESGISLSEYIMPGVGGKSLSKEHALETARLLNTIRPDYIRVRTFAMHPESPMQKMVEEGTFFPMSDEEIVAEIRLLVSNLDEMHSYFRSGDFSLNLLMGVDGYLDSQKDKMLQEIDAYLSLSKRQKQAYSLLHRSGHYFQNLDDLVRDKRALEHISGEIEKLETNGKDAFNDYIHHLMSYQLPQPQTNTWT